MYHKENLNKLKRRDDLAPQAMKVLFAFDEATVAAVAIRVKHKELIAFDATLATQCPYGINIHNANARKAGATGAELAEAACERAWQSPTRTAPCPN